MTSPVAARVSLSVRANQHAIPKASKAAPAIRATANPIGSPILGPSRRETTGEGNANSAIPTIASKAPLTASRVFVIAPLQLLQAQRDTERNTLRELSHNLQVIVMMAQSRGGGNCQK